MGWFNKLFENPITSTLQTYAYNTGEHFFNQIGTIPKVLKDLRHHLPSRTIVNTTLSTITDILPVLLLHTANNYIQSTFRNGVDENASILSIDGTLLLTLELINTSLSIYTWHQASKAFIKNTTATICAPSAFSQVETFYIKPESICKPQCNGTLVLLNGAMNETSAYYSNQFAIWATNKIPYAGWYISEYLSIHAKGRYIAGLTTTRCRKHQFLKSESTLSIGLAHKGFELLMHQILQSTIGTPPYLCMLIFNQLPLLLTIAFAAHQPSPLVTKENRTLVDLLDLYEDTANCVVIGVLNGLQTQIKKILNGSPSTLPWQQIADKALLAYKHPYTHKSWVFFTPNMLHNWDDFINEPMIIPCWSAIQKQLIYIIGSLEAGQQSKLVNLANRVPDQAATLFQFLFGFPKPVAKILLDIMGNNNYMSILTLVRRWLEVHGVKHDIGLALQKETIPLRMLESAESSIKPNTAHHPADAEKDAFKEAELPRLHLNTDPNQFFQPHKKQKRTSAKYSEYFMRPDSK